MATATAVLHAPRGGSAASSPYRSEAALHDQSTQQRMASSHHSHNIDVSHCRQCGADVTYDIASRVAEDAQRRIAELEGQVKILTGKATAAVDKLADYEDQLHQLRTQQKASANDQEHLLRPNSPSATTRPPSQPRSSSAASDSTAAPGSVPITDLDSVSTTAGASASTPPAIAVSTARPGLSSRITNLLPSTSLRRAASPALVSPGKTPSQTSSQTPHTFDPQTTQAQRSSYARFSFTGSLTSSATNNNNAAPTASTAAVKAAAQQQAAEEIEELSAALFTEANEMVAAERKARKKLEERVEVLERRDREKKERLVLLEGRMGRIERVRGLLAPGSTGAGVVGTGAGMSKA